MWDTKDGSVAVPRRTSPAVTALVVATMLIPGIGVQYIGSVIPEFEYSWTGWLVSIGLTALCIVVITIKNRRVDLYERARSGHEAAREALVTKLADESAPSHAPRARKRQKRRPVEVDDAG